MKKSIIKVVKKVFQKSKIITIEKLSKELNYSISSTRTFLKAMGYYRSITNNCKFYTLTNSPCFDKNGLWNSNGKTFSKHGNLNETLTFFINKSKTGLSSKELHDILGFSCTVTLNKMKKNKSITSLMSKGKCIYLSQNESIKKEQLCLLSKSDIEVLPSLSKSIIILVTMLNNKDLNDFSLLELLNDKGVFLNKTSFDFFLMHYGIQKKTLYN